MCVAFQCWIQTLKHPAVLSAEPTEPGIDCIIANSTVSPNEIIWAYARYDSGAYIPGLRWAATSRPFHISYAFSGRCSWGCASALPWRRVAQNTGTIAVLSRKQHNNNAGTAL